MQAIRVALVQLPWLESRASMISQYETMVADAARRGAALVCLPELSLSPYFPGNRDPEGLRWAEPLTGGDSDRAFSRIARLNHVTLIASIVEQTPDGHVYDTATIHAPDGTLVGYTRKIHIPSGAGYHETDYFAPGDTYPVHNLGALTVATPTCYDQWFPELARIYAMHGAEYIFYPTAIGSEPSAPDVDTSDAWQTIMRGHAIANGVYLGAANRVGEENGVTFYGKSFICDPMGRIIAQAGRDTTEVITADLDPALFAHWRDLFPLLTQRMPHTYATLAQAYAPPS